MPKSITSLADLQPDPRNARRHTPRNVGMIERALNEVGAARSIVVDENGRVLAGNATIEAAAQAGIERVQVVDADGETIVAVRRSGLTEEQKARLALFDNRAAELAGWDAGILAELAQETDLSQLFNDDELAALLEQAGTEIINSAADDEPPVEASDTLFPTDNDWGVPVLDLKLQARGLDLPCERWGRGSRHNGKMSGTWHFYTDDYKFAALWAAPTPIVYSGCHNIIEPNVSTNAAMPRAVALWGIYRKRWIARWAQSYGIGVFVDLNVDPAFADLNLLGVPRGWQAWATRGYDAMIDALDADYQIARMRAETDDIVFVVVGGGRETHAHCMACGWVHVPQEAHIVEGREYLHGQG